ncbi:DNA-binding protein SMUBP-2 [Coemansia reversa NRRL 1564]|uniref:DNA helicase n=1 Tax=Coemansia reversa (strain ATCC 12441 / NRRL 1564) TaxID=763665 RepID=A0A2G5BHU2_COERN|nr:DNA-binding protein SMUBP-2 [Coemansia reversa NRRL 1564]|eukprot:PIA18594.1 DNA-binding protein SMUBP-2 [Coemansia reversa NRRL 1564]
MAATQLQRLGFALAGLRITATRTGLGGRLLVTAEAAVAGDALPPTALRAGDIVGVERAGGGHNTEALLEGVVWTMAAARVVVALGSDAVVPTEWRERCSVRKLANDTPYRRMLQALRDLAAVDKRPMLHSVLFGDAQPRFEEDADIQREVEELDEAGDADQLNGTDESCTLNPSQLAAVRRAVTARDVALIHGPPGTGKTHTLVEVVRRLAVQGKAVLVCAPSNVAVDNMAERLARKRVRVVRLGHPARMLPGVAAHGLDSCVRESDGGRVVADVRREIDATLAQARKSKRAGERRALYAQVRELRGEHRRREAAVVRQTICDAQVVLATLSGAAGRSLRSARHAFDVVVVDEATQALEAECWIAALLAPVLILAGDHHQLPPTLRCRNAPPHSSMFARVRARFGDAVCCMLTTQYRMHVDIMRVPADVLYDARLVAHPSVGAHVLADLEGIESTDDTCAPLVFVDTATAAMLESADDASPLVSDADSRLNRGEAALVVRHVEALVAAGLHPRQIAVISPYNAQVRLLVSLLRPHFPDLEIGSVDGFQGREKEAVVLSLVRSNPAREIGFLADYRRINVAVTRARRHLCIVADSTTVAARNPFLKALFAHLEAVAELRFPD